MSVEPVVHGEQVGGNGLGPVGDVVRVDERVLFLFLLRRRRESCDRPSPFLPILHVLGCPLASVGAFPQKRIDVLGRLVGYGVGLDQFLSPLLLHPVPSVRFTVFGQCFHLGSHKSLAQGVGMQVGGHVVVYVDVHLPAPLVGASDSAHRLDDGSSSFRLDAVRLPEVVASRHQRESVVERRLDVFFLLL